MDSTRTQQERIDAVVKQFRNSGTFKEAMKLIDPAPERATECEQRLLNAMEVIVFYARRFDGFRTPAEIRGILAKQVETLRKIEDDAIYERAFRDHARRERERIEPLNEREVPLGSRRPSSAKFNAVRFAHDLLADFGKRKPGLSRDGNWHKLALILFGNAEADLFDYMQLFKSRPEPPRDEMFVPEWIAPLLVR